MQTIECARGWLEIRWNITSFKSLHSNAVTLSEPKPCSQITMFWTAVRMVIYSIESLAALSLCSKEYMAA